MRLCRSLKLRKCTAEPLPDQAFVGRWLRAAPKTLRVNEAGGFGKTQRRTTTLNPDPLANGSKDSATFDQPRGRTRERGPGFPDSFEVEWRVDTVAAKESSPSRPIALQ